MSERYNNLDAMMERYKEEMRRFYNARGETEPVSVTQAPMPVTQAPMPVTQAPMPVTQAPMPVVQAPMPVTQAPMPVTQAPAPMPGREPLEFGMPEPPVVPTTETPTPAPNGDASQLPPSVMMPGLLRSDVGEGEDREDDTAYDGSVPAEAEPMNDEGYIKVDTFTARGAVPIPGADVVIDRTDPGDTRGRRALVRIAVTDSSGETGTYQVETVSRTLSEAPGTAHPYATYYVSVRVPGYERVMNRPVDVFGGEVSEVPLELVPLPNNKAVPPSMGEGS